MRRAAIVLILAASTLCLAAVTVINLATQVTGVLATANGGTGVNSTTIFPTSGVVVGTTTTALTPSTTVSLNVTTGSLFTLVPAQAETINATNCATAKPVQLIITTSGTSSFVLTFSTNFKTTGTLTTGTVSAKVFAMNFVCNGATLTELSRTAAM